MVGAVFALTAGYMIFVPQVPLYIGRHLAVTLAGWKKAYLVVPCVGLGLAFILYAPELTCIASKYKYLCA